MASRIDIDGSFGEGGGQIVRTCLALSALTGRPLRISRIRARRRRPGLRQQHLTAVRAAAAVCGARLEGDRLGSSEVYFEPGPIRAGDHTFSVGTAGSATLVLQTVLPPLLRADGPSQITIEGGTHNPMAPPFEFIERCFLPQLAAMGASVNVVLDRHGFYPAGGGRLRAEITPASSLVALDLTDGGPVRRRQARALLCKLPVHVARRELAVVQNELGWREDECEIEEVGGHHGPTNLLMLEVERDAVTEIVTGFGDVGVASEQVAAGAVAEMARYLDVDAPVGVHLADQLLLPMAMGGGGRFRTVGLSQHSRTNIEVIRRFLDVEVRVEEFGGAATVVVLP